MPRPSQKTLSALVTADTTVTTTAETAVATLPGINTGSPDEIVEIVGWVQMLIGTATTGLTLRVRRGSVAGALVGEANLEIVAGAAGSIEDHEIRVTDNPGEVANQTYVLTVTQTAATGNGTASQAELEATVGN